MKSKSPTSSRTRNAVKIIFGCLSSMLMLSAATNSHAQGVSAPNVPSFNVRGGCKVNVPESIKDLDGGFMTDELCQNIFVFPPALGKVRVSTPSFLDVSYCAAIHSLRDDAAQAAINAKNSKSISKTERIRILADFDDIDKQVARIGKKQSYAAFGFTLSLDWDDVVRAYQAANPGMNAQRMPIVAGALDAGLSDALDAGTGDDGVVLKYRLFGAKQKKDDSGNLTGEFLKKVTSGYDMGNSTVFYNAVAGDMNLTLRGACYLFDSNGKVINDPKSHVTATYTYFYPVTTTASYGLHFEGETFGRAVMPIIRANNGKITSEQLAKALADSPAVEVHITNSIGSDTDGEQLKKTYEAQMKNVVATTVLSVIADRIQSTVTDDTYTTSTQYRRTTCWQPFNWPCSSYTYWVTNTDIHWDDVDAKVRSILNLTVGASKTSTIYLYGTSAFANVMPNQSTMTVNNMPGGQ